MPTYDYTCGRCGSYERLRPLSQRDDPLACEQCGGASIRVLGGAPGLALMDGATRGIIRGEERAASKGVYARMRHPLGCGCCR